MLRFALASLLAASVPAARAYDQTFVLLDGRTGKTTVDNASRAKRRFAPCSSFKIPHSLILLESGAVPDPEFTVAYDAKRDGEQGAWAHDQSLRSAVRTSAAWYFQEMARRAGIDVERRYVEQFRYGNQSLAPAVDKFWLGAGLRISPEEQVDFLRRMREHRLGLSPRTTETVHELIRLETTDQYRWYGKTGTCTDAEQGPVAWHVGFVEREGTVSYYALNFGGGPVMELFEARKAMIRERLGAAGLIEREAPSRRSQMEARVRAVVQAFPGTVSLSARNLDTGEAFSLEEDRRVRTASTIKLPIMAAVFGLIEEGRASWDEKLTLRAQDIVPGSGVLHEFSPGIQLPLRDVLHLMIVVSDNTATNLIIERFTADTLNVGIRRLGLKQTLILRKVMGGAPAREGATDEYKPFGLGVTTPREMAMLLEKIERGDAVSRAASKEMLAILKRQQFKDGIGRRLPDAQVASKSGALDRLRSDAGIVRSPAGRFVLAFTVDDMRRTDYSPENAGNALIAELTAIVMEGLGK